MRRQKIAWLLVALAMLLAAVPALGEEAVSTRWADAADAIDKYLDKAFEDYLEGNAASAYSNVSDAYFRVYEVTGFERQTMSYISGNRKNAVEMQFSGQIRLCPEPPHGHKNHVAADTVRAIDINTAHR